MVTTFFPNFVVAKRIHYPLIELCSASQLLKYRIDSSTLKSPTTTLFNAQAATASLP